MNPSITFPQYKQQETAASILMQAHCTVIEELLDATIEYQSLFANDGCPHPLVPAYSLAAVTKRFLNAQRAYCFVARAVNS